MAAKPWVHTAAYEARYPPALEYILQSKLSCKCIPQAWNKDSNQVLNLKLGHACCSMSK
jgi:hypothetical protein